MTTELLLREIAAGYGFALAFAALGSLGLTLFDGFGSAGAALGYIAGSVVGVAWMAERAGVPGSVVAAAVPVIVVWLWPVSDSHGWTHPGVLLKMAFGVLLPVVVALCYNVSVFAE